MNPKSAVVTRTTTTRVVPKNKGQTTTVKSTPKRAKRNSARNRSSPTLRSPNMQLSEADHFMAGLMYPDLYGPIRVPLPGEISKSILGMDRSKWVITGDATNTVQGIVVDSKYSNAYYSSGAVSETSVFSASNSNAPGVQYPSGNNIVDVRLVGFSILVEYLGNPLNAQGEVILGTYANFQGSLSGAATNYSTLWYGPDTVHVPAAKLVEEPLRISGYHYSPDSWSYYGPTVAIPDLNVPFVVCSGLPTGAKLSLEVIRTWEVRPTVASSGFAIPYESTGASRSSDESLFTDVSAYLASTSTTLSQALPDLLRPVLRGVASTLPDLVSTSSRTMLNYAMSRVFNGLRNSQGRIAY